MVGNKNTLPTLHKGWWAAKTRYPRYPPYIFNEDGGQQKHATHPTYLMRMVGSKNTLPTLHKRWWATKTRYPPYIKDGGQQKHVTHPT